MSSDTSKINGINRRRFIQGSASFAVAAGLGSTIFSSETEAHNWNSGWKHPPHHDNDKKLWRKVRNEFSLNKANTYMNTGTTGSIPNQVLEQYEKNSKIVARSPWDMENKFGDFPYTTEMVDDIASSFGADPYEIILSRNTTDGMCTIINGLQFEPGDVILTTHHEHIAATSPLNVVKQRFGVNVVEVQLPIYTGTETVSEDDYIEAFRSALNAHSNVRLLTFSHITYKTGTKLPAKRLCELAKQYGIPTLIDGAHTFGMLDIDLHDIDCDFYSGSGHKWQCGPGATGILYVRDNANRLSNYWSDRSNPLWFINSSLSEAAYLGTQVQMQYIGNDNYPAKQALADSCKLWDKIGRDKIEKRIFELSRLCKSLLADALPHAYQFSPNDDAFLSGITSFNPFKLTDNERLLELRDRLRNEYGYIIRTTDFKLYKDDTEDSHALRISTHIFNDEDDIRGLVSAIKHLYKKMA